MEFGALILWVIVAIVLVALVVIVVVVVTKNRRSAEEEPVVDPPYDRRGFDDPTVDDPQAEQGVHPGGARFVEDPGAVRNPTIDSESAGQSTPGIFPPPRPPRE